MHTERDIRALALEILLQRDPHAKAAAARRLDPQGPLATFATVHEPQGRSQGESRSAQHAGCSMEPQGRSQRESRSAQRAGNSIEPAAGIPGRPERPALVPFNALQRRSASTAAGRAVLIHALAHIELNAIDLALDIVWRFAGLPEAFYRDWVQVAREEALHFELLTGHLQTLGHDYGDFPAHNGLWEMAEKTRQDPLARLALVPRTLEARGLDASPPMRARLHSAGDTAAAAILDIILRDEIGHVAVGNHWYRYLCRQRGLDPIATYTQLAAALGAPRLRGPFNLPARRAAGFDEIELALLQADPTPCIATP